MFTVVVSPPGGDASEITPVQQSVRFTTAAVGGFGSCSFQLAGDGRRSVPYLATVRVMVGMAVAWEGRVEDVSFAPADEPAMTQVSCFGFQRLLTDTSVRRIWASRSLSWKETPAGIGGDLHNGVIRGDMVVTIGQYLPSDLTKNGFQIAGNNVSCVAGGGATADLTSPVTIARVMGDLVLSGANTGGAKFRPSILYSNDGFATDGSNISDSPYSATGAVNGTANGKTIRFFFFNSSGGALTPTATDLAQFSNIRILGTSLTEDASGGFYGGTILRDLIALIPSIGTGLIEDGSDYTIPEIERAVRGAIADVIKEVSSYYTREWAVWDGPTFNWKTPNLDEPQWIATLDQLLPGSRFEGSVDTLARTVYILYSLAGSDTSADGEQSSTATDQRNPFVKTSATKDTILQAPAVMTDNTAAQLAAVAAAENTYPPVTGTIVLAATQLIQNAVSSAQPAALIRAGSNIYIPDLPRTDSLLPTPGRDGQTLFHIVGTELDMEAGTITLELEGQGRQLDVITARLASATRVLTG